MYFSILTNSSTIEDNTSGTNWICKEKRRGRMKRNPLLPFVAIAAIAVVAMVILSFQGYNKSKQMANGESQVESTSAEPKDIVQETCISCHGENLKGGVGPDLTKVGSRLSEEDIKGILINGKDGGMPAGLVSAEEAGELARWLAETYK